MLMENMYTELSVIIFIENRSHIKDIEKLIKKLFPTEMVLERGVEFIFINCSEKAINNIDISKYIKVKTFMSNSKIKYIDINNAIREAMGKYISFIKVDDKIAFEKDAYIKLLDAAIENHSSVVTGKIVNKEGVPTDNTKYIKKYESFKAHKKPEVMNDLFYIGKIFDKDLLVEKEIYFNEKLKNSEMYFVFTAMAEAEKITTIPESIGIGYNSRELKEFNLENIKSIITSTLFFRRDLRQRDKDVFIPTIDKIAIEDIYERLESVSFSEKFFVKISNLTRYYFKTANKKAYSNLLPKQKYIFDAIVEGRSNCVELTIVVLVNSTNKKDNLVTLINHMSSVVTDSGRFVEFIFINSNRRIKFNAINSLKKISYREIRSTPRTQYADINNAIREAMGKYISFIKVDDKIAFEKDAYIKLLDAAIENHSSVVTGKIVNKEGVPTDNTKYIKKYESFKAHKKPEVMNDLFYIGKIFDKDLLVEKEIYFNEKLKNSEMYFVFIAMAEAEKITTIPEVLGSIEHSVKERKFSFDDIEEKIKEIRLLKCSLKSRGTKEWSNIIDNLNIVRLFENMPDNYNLDQDFLLKFAEISEKYFRKVNLSKITNLSPLQRFIIKSIATKEYLKNEFIELSCVIPVYGAEKYLETCLLSILKNTKRKIEVIAINDGSPDNSKKILDRLAQQYENLKVIHQENMGGAATINKGLYFAKGEYITIVDNDDWLAEGSLDKALDSIFNEDVEIDILITQIVKKWPHKEEISFDSKYIKSEEIFIAHKKPGVMNDGMYLGKLFNKNFLIENTIKMDATLLYADRPFMAIALSEAKRIKIFPESIYYWRQREDNVNKSITDRMYEESNIRDRIKSIQIMKFELKARGYNYWIDTIDYFNINRIFWTLQNRKFKTLVKFAEITKPYFSTVNLDKMTHLTPVQKFIVNSIVNDSANKFAIEYTTRLLKHKFMSIKKKSLNLYPRKKAAVGKTGNIIKNLDSTVLKDDQLIIFESNFGKIYGAQPKYIYEELLKQKRVFRAVWVYQGKETHKNIPGHVVQVHRGSQEYFEYLAKAKYWVNNIRFTVTYKPKGTIYLNTWHGTPLKRLGLDIEVEGPEAEARENFLKESRNWDYLLAQNEFAAKTLKRAFDVKGKVLTYGYPANEIFYTDNLQQSAEAIRKKLSLPEDKKVILYAPTWRDDLRKGNKWEYSFNLQLNLNRMQDELGREYILLLRLHHLVSDKLNFEKYSKFVYDVSQYDDTSEILAISDILITDYSSIFFDYGSLKRPILFYMYDYEKYVSKLRGFYLDTDKDLPGEVIHTFDRLMDRLKNIEEYERVYREKMNVFYQTYCFVQNDKMTEKIVNEVFKELPFLYKGV